MSEEWKDITISKPRKTFISGKVLLKCRSTRFLSKLDGHNVEMYLIKKVLEATISLDKTYSELQENQQKHKRKHKRAKIPCNIILPDQILCNVKGENQPYQIRVLEAKFTKDPKIYHVMVEDDKSYATYEGVIVGYLYDTVSEVKRVKVVPPTFELVIENSGDPLEKVMIDGVNYNTPFRKTFQKGTYLLGIDKTSYSESGKQFQFSHWSDGETSTIRLLSLDNNKTIKPIYAVVEEHASNEFDRPKNKSLAKGLSMAGCLSNIGVIIVYLWIGTMVVGLISAIGVKILYILGALLLLYGFVNYGGFIIKAVQGIAKVLFAVFLAFFALSIGIGLFATDSISLPETRETPKEKRTTAPIVEEQVEAIGDNTQNFDTLIVQTREWVDYDGNEYSTELKMKKSIVNSVENYRNSMPSVGTLEEYSMLYSEILKYGDNQNSFQYIYQNLDTIRVNRQLNKRQFAEMVISMVQDIPYVLILPRACDKNQYADLFIKEYLQNNKPCSPNVKNGLFAPEEFLSNLNGDCDTRTVTVFKILTHYGYDVRIYNSEKFGHSVIGLNLRNMNGTTFVSKGKPYLICETTAYGSPPGEYNSVTTNQNYWQTALYNSYD